MRPTKVKELIPGVSERLGLTEKEGKLIAGFYFEKVRSTLSTLASPKVMVDNLGTFYVKHWLFDKYIKKFQCFIQSPRCTDIVKERAAENLKLLFTIKEMHEGEKQRKSFVKLHKRASYELEKENKKNLEEPGGDMGGVLQPSPELQGAVKDPESI